MATQNEHDDPSKLAAALRQLRREAKLLHHALGREEELADSLLQNLIALEESLPPKCLDSMNDGAASTPRNRAPTDSTFLLKLAAQNGVEKLEFEWLADGAARVRVEGGKAFPLSPAPAALLKILVHDKPGDEERLVVWKSRGEVHARFQKRTGRKVAPHAIDGLLSRLRRALARGGVNPFFVQTHRQFGLRFALRRARKCEESCAAVSDEK